MENKFLLELAIILISTKALGLLMRRIGMPQVVGALIAGLIIGPILFIVRPSNILKIFAEIGVIMIIFTAGLETNIKEIKNTSKISVLVAIGGILIPLISGFLLASAFYGFNNIDKVTLLRNIFIGVILTATSISISVQVLKEMGKLNTRVGTIIMSAAIIDDIVGIVILSMLLGIRTPDVSPVITILKTFAFFAVAIGIGVILHWFFKKSAYKHQHQRRIPIFALAICLLYAYSAEKLFGVADITGAYIAGIIFSGISYTHYIEQKIETNAYMIFAPVFFAYIGIQSTFYNFDMSLVWFTIALVLVGVLSKYLGCYIGSRLCRVTNKESMIIGIGMVARGEVALVMMQKGIVYGIIEAEFLPIVIVLVIVTSLFTPILMKLIYKGECTSLSLNEHHI